MLLHGRRIVRELARKARDVTGEELTPYLMQQKTQEGARRDRRKELTPTSCSTKESLEYSLSQRSGAATSLEYSLSQERSRAAPIDRWARGLLRRTN